MAQKEPCGNTECDKCYPTPRWKVSQHRIQHITYEREIKAATAEEAVEIFERGTAWPSLYDERGGEVIQRDEIKAESMPSDEFHPTNACWYELFGALSETTRDEESKP
jgi:hypothetical protein